MHCDKIGYSKTQMGSCIGHQVKMTESALQEAIKRRLHAFNPFRCAECGDTVELVTGPGRVELYARGKALPVPDDARLAANVISRLNVAERSLTCKRRPYVSVARSSPI